MRKLSRLGRLDIGAREIHTLEQQRKSRLPSKCICEDVAKIEARGMTTPAAAPIGVPGDSLCRVQRLGQR